MKNAMLRKSFKIFVKIADGCFGGKREYARYGS